VDAHIRIRRLTLAALLTALSVALLFFAGLTPSGKLGLSAAAGLIPAVAVLREGVRTGFLCYAGTSILALMLLPSKLPALLYTILLGHYPMLKALIERLRKRSLEWLCKLALANALFFLLRRFLWALLVPALPEALEAVWPYYLAGNVAFIAYDIGFSKLIDLYRSRTLKRGR
jgi:hypothetical protein